MSRAKPWGKPNKSELIREAARVALAAALVPPFKAVERSAHLDDFDALIRERAKEPTPGAPSCVILRGPRAPSSEEQSEPTKGTTKRLWIISFGVAIAVFDVDPVARDTTIGDAETDVVNELHTFGVSQSFSALGRTLTVEGSTPLTVGREDIGPYAALIVECQAHVWE